MKRDEISLKLKVMDWEKNGSIPWTFAKFCDIVCPNFCLFSMAWMTVIEIKPILDNIRQFFQVILMIFTLNNLGFYTIYWEIMRFYKSLRKSMKVNESYNIPQNFLGKIIHFCSLSFICNVLCWLSLLLLVISKYDCRISVLLRKFQNFELLNLFIVKDKTFNIPDT
jgi:hypothetical protein